MKLFGTELLGGSWALSNDEDQVVLRGTFVHLQAWLVSQWKRMETLLVQILNVPKDPTCHRPAGSAVGCLCEHTISASVPQTASLHGDVTLDDSAYFAHCFFFQNGYHPSILFTYPEQQPQQTSPELLLPATSSSSSGFLGLPQTFLQVGHARNTYPRRPSSRRQPPFISAACIHHLFQS